MVTNREALGNRAHDAYGSEANAERVQNAPGVKQVNDAINASQSAFESGFNAVGDIADGDLAALAEDTTSTIDTIKQYVSDTAGTIANIVSDPIGWLIENGLDFLLEWVKPLEDLLELVTGDPDALNAGADAFNQLGADIDQLRAETERQLLDGLAEWSGDAAEAAGAKFAEFRDGMSGTAGATGNIADLLASSAMMMTIVRDVVLGVISDFVEWLIITWVAAQAAAIPTCGASEAAAAGATAGQAALATSRATREVGRFEKMLDKIKNVIDKIKQFLQKARTFIDDPGKGIKGASKAAKKWGEDAPRNLQAKFVNEKLTPTVANDIRDSSKTANQAAKSTIKDGWKDELGESFKRHVKEDVGGQFTTNREVEHKYSDTGETVTDENGDAKTTDKTDVVRTALQAKQNYDNTIGRQTENGDPTMPESEIDRKLNF